MKTETVYDILNMLQTMQDAVKQMKEEYVNQNLGMFNTLSMDLWDGLLTVQDMFKADAPTDDRNRLAEACICALASLKDIRILSVKHSEKTEWKLEYELLAVIETMALQFYYWYIVNKQPEMREIFLTFVANSETFRILRRISKDCKFEFDLTICVTGYNHLSYTKQCVNSILENLPRGISYELILINHGSTDGTKEYFESIKGARVINIAVNGALPGVYIKAFKGRCILSVSNDVIIGTNAISNLYRCVTENRDYGYIVPSTPAVSNLQTIPAAYDNGEQFLKFTAQNNIYNERRHEQRVRLCNPATMVPTSVYLQYLMSMYVDIFCYGNMLLFPDDRLSLWMRRNGYKNILAKDAFCHHFGSITIKRDIEKQEEKQLFYQDGRKAFYDRYGIDPWGPGFCFDPGLFDEWEISVTDHAVILGINCGLGSNSLKLKEVLKEKGAVDTKLYNCVQQKRYLKDLQGISDKAFLFFELGDIINMIERRQYNYIVAEEPIQGTTQESPVEDILNAGLEFDELAYKSPDGKWRIVKRDISKQ